MTQTFLEGQPFNVTGSSSIESIARRLQTNASLGDLGRLDRSDCISTYSDNLLGQYSNVLLVTNLTESAWSPPENPLGRSTNRASGSAFDYFVHYPSPPNDMLPFQDINWKCDDTAGPIAPCTNHTNPWLVEYCSSELCPTTSNASVLYCLAQEVKQSCKVELSLETLIVVIVFNGLKAFCFAFAVRKKGFGALVTLGDTISSFLSHPDRFTFRLGNLSADEVYSKLLIPGRRRYSLSLLERSGSGWNNIRAAWFSGASACRWALTIIL